MGCVHASTPLFNLMQASGVGDFTWERHHVVQSKCKAESFQEWVFKATSLLHLHMCRYVSLSQGVKWLYSCMSL